MSRQGYAQPVRPVGQLVFDLVERLFQQKEIEQRSAARGSAGHSRALVMLSR